MQHLFATTDLERSYRVNMNVIGLDGRPQIKALDVLLREWVMHRKITVRRRTEHRLEKVMARLHLLEGFLTAFLNIDDIITIIRNEDAPKQVLMAQLSISAAQADAILDLKLRQLAKLEETKIRTEQTQLAKERNVLKHILRSDSRLNQVIKDELLHDVNLFQDRRLSPIVERKEAVVFDASALVASEAVTIVLSKKGWIRAAKGHEQDSSRLAYKAGDAFLVSAEGKSHQSTLCLDSMGRVYTVTTHQLPSVRGYGDPLRGKLKCPADTDFVGLMIGEEDHQYLLATDLGYGFIVRLGEMVSRNKSGKNVLTVPSMAHVLQPIKIQEGVSQCVALVSSEGRLLVITLEGVPHLSKGKGNKLISIPATRLAEREECVVDMCVLGADHALVVYAGRRHLKLSFDDLNYYRGERGRRGSKLPRGFQRVDRLDVAVN